MEQHDVRMMMEDIVAVVVVDWDSKVVEDSLIVVEMEDTMGTAADSLVDVDALVDVGFALVAVALERIAGNCSLE
jgi:hypothetical protein